MYDLVFHEENQTSTCEMLCPYGMFMDAETESCTSKEF